MRGDTILDPFLGTGTTTLAAITSERNSIGIEIDENMKETIIMKITDLKKLGNEYILKRIQKHNDFIYERVKIKGPTKYINEKFKFPVITSQEIHLKFNLINKTKLIKENEFEIEYMEVDNEFIKTGKKLRDLGNFLKKNLKDI